MGFRIRRALYNALPLGLLFLIVACFGGVVWLTHHPETPWLAEAEEWPVLGHGARWIRDTYLPPEETRLAEGEEGEREEFGTEVIVLLPDGKVWDGESPLDLTRMGQQGTVGKKPTDRVQGPRSGSPSGSAGKRLKGPEGQNVPEGPEHSVPQGTAPTLTPPARTPCAPCPAWRTCPFWKPGASGLPWSCRARRAGFTPPGSGVDGEFPHPGGHVPGGHLKPHPRPGVAPALPPQPGQEGAAPLGGSPLAAGSGAVLLRPALGVRLLPQRRPGH